MELTNKVVERRVGAKVHMVIMIYYKENGEHKQKRSDTGITLQEYHRGGKKRVEEMRATFVREFTEELSKRRGLDVDYAKLSVKGLMQKYADDIHRKGKINDFVYIKYSAGKSYQNKMCEYLSKIGQPNMLVTQFTENHAEALMDCLRKHKGRSGAKINDNTIKHYLAFYRPAFKFALKKKWISSDPFSRIECPSVKVRKPKFFSIEDAEKVWKEAESEVECLRAPVHLGILTGMRRSELLALKWNCIDFADGNWTKGKIRVEEKVLEMESGVLEFSKELKTERSRRVIDLTPQAWNILMQQKRWVEQNKKAVLYNHDHSDYVFVYRLGKPIRPSRLSRTIERICERAGIEGHLHLLRHTYATYLRKSGVDVTVISSLLGHSTIATTGNFYLGVDDDDRRQATDKLSEFMTFAKASGEN